jgi:hypothetical protein
MSDAESFAGRIFGSVIATMDLFSIHLGDRLGYYRALADGAVDPRRARGPDRDRCPLRP